SMHYSLCSDHDYVLLYLCFIDCFLSISYHFIFSFFFFTNPPTTEIYTLSLHDALPISRTARDRERAETVCVARRSRCPRSCNTRSEEHTSELQSLRHLVCRLLLEKKKKKKTYTNIKPRHVLRLTPQQRYESQQ